MSIYFPNLGEVIKIYLRKGAKQPMLSTQQQEKTEDKVEISEEARQLALKNTKMETQGGKS